MLNLILDYLLIPKYGWVGAVIATNISSLLAVGTLLTIGFRAFPVALELRRLAIVAVTGAALFVSFVMTHELRSYYFYFINSGVLITIASFSLLRTRFFDSHEKQFIMNLIASQGLRMMNFTALIMIVTWTVDRLARY